MATSSVAQGWGGFRATLADTRLRRVFDTVAVALLFFFVQQWLWPAPRGVIVQGVVIGGLTSLLAFGLALTYRSNRIINFATGDLGGAPAALGVLLIVGPGLPYFVAMPIALLAAIALGALVELLFIRRFFKAPRLILTVVTIGIAGLLAGVEAILPKAFDIQVPPQSFPSPFDFSFEISPIIFRGNDIIAMLAVPVAIAALAGFFRFTRIGIAVRASAESAERASLLGVPVKRLQTIVWVVSTVLATVAILLRAGIVGLPLGSAVGPGILLRALAACVIGRMEKLPTIFVASVALGIIEQSIVFSTGQAGYVDPILFLVVLGALLLQRRSGASRLEDAQQSSWQAAKAVRPIPRELVSLIEVRRAIVGLKIAMVAALVAVPLVLPESRVNLAGVIVIFGIIGLSLVVLTGWAGQVSLGQMAFVGIGAAVGGWATSSQGWDLLIALPLAGLAGAAAAVVIGLPALRIRGLFLAVTTLAFALAMSTYGLNVQYISWLPKGRVPRPLVLDRIQTDTEARFYFVILACFAFAVWMVNGLRRSHAGRVLIGVRENERGAQSFGVNVIGAKLTAFAVSGFLAAFAGCLLVHHQQALGISAYLPQESLKAFVMVVIGGLGSVPGALIGAAYLQGVTYFASDLPAAVRNLVTFLSTGLGVVVVLLVLPSGLGSLLYTLRDRLLRELAARKRIHVPSLVADSRTDIEEPPVLVGAGK
jgi:branched-chain amino acid transport system permease protein